MHQTCAIAFFYFLFLFYFFQLKNGVTKKKRVCDDDDGVLIILICGHKTKFGFIRKNSCRFHTEMDQAFFFFSLSLLFLSLRWLHNIATRTPMN